MGRNCTVTVQLPLAASELVQVVLTKEKPAPLTEAALGTVIGNAMGLLLVYTTVCVADVLTSSAPKVAELTVGTA